MKGRGVYPHIGLIPIAILKLFFEHFWLQKSQASLEVANPVRQTLLTWTSEAARHMFSLSTLSNNNLGGITSKI